MGLPPKDTSSAKVLAADFTVGAEASNVINVAVQLEGPVDQEPDRRLAVFGYLSTDAEGDNVAATAPTGGFAIGTNGVAIEVVADKAAWFVSNASGAFDIDITDTGTPTFYLVLVQPTGDLLVSDAITFA